MLRHLKLAFVWLPRIVVVVRMVEAIVEPGTTGADKRDAAIDALRKLGMSDELVAVAGSLIDTVVTVLNTFGVFDRDAGETPGEVAEPERSKLVAAAVRAPEILEPEIGPNDARLDELEDALER